MTLEWVWPLPAQTSEHPLPSILYFTEKWRQAMPIPTHNMNHLYNILHQNHWMSNNCIKHICDYMPDGLYVCGVCMCIRIYMRVSIPMYIHTEARGGHLVSCFITFCLPPSDGVCHWTQNTTFTFSYGGWPETPGTLTYLSWLPIVGVLGTCGCAWYFSWKQDISTGVATHAW